MTPRENEIHRTLYPSIIRPGVQGFCDPLLCPSLDEAIAALFTEPCTQNNMSAWCSYLLVTAGMIVVVYAPDAPDALMRVRPDILVPKRKYVYRVRAKNEHGVHELTLADTIDDDAPPNMLWLAFVIGLGVFTLLFMVFYAGFTTGRVYENGMLTYAAKNILDTVYVYVQGFVEYGQFPAPWACMHKK